MRRKFVRVCAALLALLLVLGAAAESVDMAEVSRRLWELGYLESASEDVPYEALENFQRANGLGVTGEADAGTLLVLFSADAVNLEDYLGRMARDESLVEPLANGSYGAEVERLQRALRDLGYLTGEVDGAFAEATEEAVCRFQLANGLPMNGVADGAVTLRLYSDSPLSWDDFLIESVAALGDTGARVRQLQYWLGRMGYFAGECTGSFGENTQQAVRQYQTNRGLEASGEANVETLWALYTDVRTLMEAEITQRRGDAGLRAEELCSRLRELGYAAHAGFDYQTELALMQFQSANGLTVTGVTDVDTRLKLAMEDAVDGRGFAPAGMEAAQAEDFTARLVQEALRLLGRVTGFDEDFGLVQYAYLKCGVAVLSRDQFAPVGEALSVAQPGDLAEVTAGGSRFCALVCEDGALIYRAADGRIVMSYPMMMQVESVSLYRLALE